jgi:hypothetical protein
MVMKSTPFQQQLHDLLDEQATVQRLRDLCAAIRSLPPSDVTSSSARVRSDCENLVDTIHLAAQKLDSRLGGLSNAIRTDAHKLKP